MELIKKHRKEYALYNRIEVIFVMHIKKLINTILDIIKKTLHYKYA